jgi:hypothetical protein
VVDVILGTAEEVAAQREATGFYEMVRKVAEENARISPPPAAVPPPLASASRAAPKRAAPEPKVEPPKRKRQTVSERIAPKKRKAGERELDQRPPAPLPGTAFLPKRTLPAPRGRFTTVDPTRANFESLFREGGKETIAALIEQVPHRVALLRTLEQGYVGRRGATLSVGDVEDLLEAHELFEAIEAKEKEGILAALVEQKGALGKAAHALGMKASELEQLAEALGVEREVDEIRQRFIKEALSEANLALRLELLFRTRYLEDLRIDRKFEHSLRDQLLPLVEEVRDAATSVPTLIDMLSRQHGLNAEGLHRCLDKLGLLEPWQEDGNAACRALESLSQQAIDRCGLLPQEQAWALPLARLAATLPAPALDRLRSSRRLPQRCGRLQRWPQRLQGEVRDGIAAGALEQLAERERLELQLDLEQDWPALALQLHPEDGQRTLMRWRDPDDPLFHPRPPLDGLTLQRELGLPPGRSLGRLLAHLMQERAFCRLAAAGDHAAVLAQARRWQTIHNGSASPSPPAGPAA